MCIGLAPILELVLRSTDMLKRSAHTDPRSGMTIH